MEVHYGAQCLKMRFVSIGFNCQVAYQIRRATGHGEAYVFDWLITPLPALLRAIEHGLVDMLRPQHLSINEAGNRVVDAATGLEHQHDFPTDEHHKVLPGFEAHVERARTRLLRRAERLFDLLGSRERVCLVRNLWKDELAPEQRAAIVRAFSRRFPASDLSFLWVSHYEAGSDVTRVPWGADWKGDDAAWDVLFRRFEPGHQ